MEKNLSYHIINKVWVDIRGKIEDIIFDVKYNTSEIECIWDDCNILGDIKRQISTETFINNNKH